jgi:hypothetical protein
MITWVLVKANVLKVTENFFPFLVLCMRHKKTHYGVYVHLHLDTGRGKISCASCTCTGGCCKYVAALLFQILDYIQFEFLNKNKHSNYFKTEKRYTADYNNPALALAKCRRLKKILRV